MGTVFRCLETLHELGRVDFEAGGELEEVVQVEVASASLDLSDECPVDVALVGECLLAETENLTARADALAESARGLG